MVRFILMAGVACMVAGCDSAETTTIADTTASKPKCESTAGESSYRGFSTGQIAEYGKQRAALMQDAKGTEGAREFAVFFLNEIALEPDSLCPSNYKTIQSLMSAEMDFESRLDTESPGALGKDQAESYIRTLYQTTGLTQERGARRLDSMVAQTLEGIGRTRKGWGQ